MKSMLRSDSLFDIYQSLFYFNHDGCYALDLEGNFVLFNDNAVEISGYAVDEVLQKSMFSILEPDCIQDMKRIHARVLSGYREKFVTSIRHKDGRRVHLAVKATPIYIDQQIAGIVGTAKDITEQNTVRDLLSGQNRVLELIAKGSSLSEVLDHIVYMVEKVSNGGRCSIYLVHSETEELVLNSAPHLPHEYIKDFERVKISPNGTLCGMATFHNRPIYVSDIATSDQWRGDRELALRYGLRSCWSIPVNDTQNQVLGTIAIYHSKSVGLREQDHQIIEKACYLTSLAIQHYQATQKINHMAFHDDLTKLPNRRFFKDRVRQLIVQTTTNMGLMYVDLDRFKLINDSLGHTIGDVLLKEVANRLKSCIGERDTAARLGGDEFTLFMWDKSREELGVFSKLLLAELGKPYYIQGHEIYLTPSIGICCFPDDGQTVEELLRKADLAMYQAKKEGKNNYQFYNEHIDNKTNRRLEIENHLRKALAKRELSLHYQPIIHLGKENEIAGVEALIRWDHPDFGRVSPDEFIPIAEETGMIVHIGEWIMRTAFLQWKAWEREGLLIPTIAVNISFRQFYQPDLIPMISRILEETEMNPKHVTLEITESMTMNVESAVHILRELKRIGVKVSIDDFGTGYSSLSYLRMFPIDSLKIDKSFIKDISHNKDDENIATTIVLMAQNLGIRVIAEGVETKEQLTILSNHHCQEVQGYLFSKPIPGAEMIDLTRLIAKGTAAEIESL